MDEMDRAQAQEQTDREMALAAMRERIDAALTPRDPAADGLCIDCDQPIEPDRIAALRGCCSRCVDCATRWEKAVREYRA